MKDKGKSSEKRNTSSGGSRRAVRTGSASGTAGSGRARSAGRPEKPSAPAQMYARFRAVFDGSRDAIGVSMAGVQVLVNPAYRALFGFPPDADLAGTPILDLVAPECRDQVKEYVARRARGESVPAIYETRGLSVDGSEFDMEVSVSLYREGEEDLTLVILRNITERKTAAQEIAERGATLRQIMDTASVAIFLVNKSGRITHANRRMAEMFACAIKDLVGSEYVSLVHPSEREIGRGKMLALLASEISSVDLERHYWRRDGTEFWGHLAGRRYHDVQGNDIGLIGVITDIDKRKRAEDALRESEMKTRSIIESIPVGMHMYRLESDGRLVFTGANPAADKILAVDNSVFIGKTIEEAFPPLKETEVPMRYRDAAAYGKAWSKESIEYHEGAIKGAFEVHAFQTAPNAMVAAFEDITSRKRSEIALKQSEEKYRRLYNETPVLLHSIDRDARVVEVNDHWLKIMCYERDEVIGRKVTDFFTEASKKYAQEVVQPAFFRDGIVKDISYQFIKKNGDVVEVLLSATGERDAAGTVFRSLAVIVDVTEIRKAEERIKESEKKYRTLFESSIDGIFIVELDGSLIDANPISYQRLGYTKEELFSRKVNELTASEFAAKVPDRIKQIQEQGAAMFETGHLRKDGSVMPVEVNSRLLDYEGRPVLFSVIRDITERKRAEVEIAEHGAMLQQIMDTASVAIGLVDMTGRITHGNRRMAEMFGRTMGELIGCEYGELVHPAEREISRQKMLALLASEVSSVDLERHYRRKDGTEFWGHLACRRFHDVHGNKLGLIGVVSDISEHKRAEDELREKEGIYRTLFEAANDGIFIQDSTGFRDCNERGAEMYGLPKEELIGRSPAEFAPERQPDGRLSAEVAGEKTRAALNGVPQFFQWQPLRADGSPFDVEITLSRLELGGEVCLQAIVRDITERKRAEVALRQSEIRFRSIIESASVGILVADVETRRFRYANPEICRLLGYSEQDFLSLTSTDLIIPAERQVSMAGFQAHAEGKLNVTERTLKRKDGSTVRMSINSVRMEFDGLPCLVGFFTDITGKRLLEEERLKAQKLESLGTLAGGIAHDFNNLLQGIFGYISMAKLTIDQREKSLAMLEQAEKALHQSVNLTSQLLTFSKGGKPVKKVVDVRPVIENAVKFALSGSRVSYDLSFGDDPCVVEADEGQIGQVVQNIVLNAEQSMPLGGRIEIAARNIPSARAAGLPLNAADGLVEIVVRDQGMGIPPEHLPRIFDPYFTTKEKGSGLGLATSYSIVKNHNGMIDISSVLGKGSTFTIYLPASRAALKPAAASVSAGRTAGRVGRVLVMDDEPIVRVVAGELLRELGHEVEFAEHGDSAIEKYRRAKAEGRPFDVVILDLTIRGGMGGLDTLRKLKEIDPGVQAVVSSGYSDDEVIATYRKHGFRSFLKKPYDIKELGRMLDDVMA